MYVIVVFVYLSICLFILFYTIAYVLLQGINWKRQCKTVGYYENLLINQQELIGQQGLIQDQHKKLLIKKLKKTDQLIAFDYALNRLREKDVLTNEYLVQIESVIIQLLIQFRRRNKMDQAYLAWFIANHSKDYWQDDLLYQTLLSYLKGSNVYVRENVLMALYRQPNAEWIIHAFQILTAHDLFHNPKLIQEGLLNHPYNRELLAQQLWEKRLTFNEVIVQGIIDFITYQSDQYKETFYELLQVENIELEMKTRFMRYFRKHYYPQAETLLVSLAYDKRDIVRIVATHALSSYPSDKVISTLKHSLTDTNWYVRRNASISLINMNISKVTISDVLIGHDQYAKEMISYQLQKEEVTV